MSDPLLRCVVAARDEEARAAWAEWRSGLVIDTMPWRDTLLVPMIPAARRRAFTAGDPAEPIFAGFVRRAWTMGSLFADRARGMVGRLHAAGLGPAMIGGSTAAFLGRTADGALRPATEITLVLPRERVDGAAAMLRGEGWEATAGVPSPAARAWTSGFTLRRGGESLRLAWRLFGVPPWQARRVERGLFDRPRETLGPEALLLSRLAPDGGWDGIVPWQADGVQLAAGGMDWAAVFHQARRLAPQIHDRLLALRKVSAAVPLPPALPSVRDRAEDLLVRVGRSILVPIVRRGGGG